MTEKTEAIQPEAYGRSTAEATAGCRYVKVPGKHISMPYGPGARAIAEAVSAFAAIHGGVSRGV